MSSLEALISAASSFSQTRGHSVDIFPIIALRTDIFDSIQNADSNKWRSAAAIVEFDRQELLDVVRYRIINEILITPEYKSFEKMSIDEVWELAFTQQFDSDDNSTKGSNAILERSVYRPRDVIAFMKIMARKSLIRNKNNSALISKDDFSAAKRDYGEHFWQEFTDEIRYIYPFADHIRDFLFNTFSDLGRSGRRRYRPEVSVNEFSELTEQLCEKLRADGHKVEKIAVINSLQRSSIIGYKIRDSVGGRIAYYYQDKTTRSLEEAESVLPHRAMANYFEDVIRRKKRLT